MMIGLIFKFKLASMLAFIFDEGIELRPLAVGQCCCKKFFFIFILSHIFVSELAHCIYISYQLVDIGDYLQVDLYVDE